MVGVHGDNLKHCQGTYKMGHKGRKATKQCSNTLHKDHNNNCFACQCLKRDPETTKLVVIPRARLVSVVHTFFDPH